MNAYRGSKSIAPLILYLSPIWKWVVNITPRPCHPRERTPVPTAWEADQLTGKKVQCQNANFMPFCWWQETKAELTRPIWLFKLWYTSQPHRSLADTTRLLLQWLMRHSLPVNASSETRNGTPELTQCRTSHCCKTQKIKMVTWGLSRMCGKIPGRRWVQRNPYSFMITFIKVVVLSLQQMPVRIP